MGGGSENLGRRRRPNGGGSENFGRRRRPKGGGSENLGCRRRPKGGGSENLGSEAAWMVDMNFSAAKPRVWDIERVKNDHQSHQDAVLTS
jgi:hypothetical protein